MTASFSKSCVMAFDSSRSCFKRRQWHPTPVLLPGKSHGQRSLVGCSPWGCQESGTIERLYFHCSRDFTHWRRKWQPTLVFLPGGSQGRGSLVACRLQGCTESDTTEATQQQQQVLFQNILLCVNHFNQVQWRCGEACRILFCETNFKCQRLCFIQTYCLLSQVSLPTMGYFREMSAMTLGNLGQTNNTDG